MEWDAAYLALGATAGFLAGLFGVGGGMILVPVLLLLFEAQNFSSEHTMHLALGTSMATILFTSVASTYKHHKHGAVNWHVVHELTPGILFGTALGTLLASSISSKGLTLFFVLFVYFAALQILINKRPSPTRGLPKLPGMIFTGTLTGGLSSLVSIGGGTIITPFLLWCNIPVRNAIATSAAIGFPVAVGGTIGYITTGITAGSGLPEGSMGFVYLPGLFWTALASICTAPLGAMTAHRMQIGLLRKLFALLLIALASKLLLKVLG